MHRRTTIRSIVRCILFVTLLTILYIFTTTLQRQDNPLLMFLTIGSIFTFLLVLLNPLFGKYSHRAVRKPTILLILLILAFQALVRLFVFSYSEGVNLLSLNTIGIIASGLMSSMLVYTITKLIYTDKEALLSSFLFAIWPTHIYLGNSNLIYSVSETMLLASILLVLYSFKYKDKSFFIVTTIAASVAFVCATTLNYAYILMLLPFCVFYLLKSLDRIKDSRYSLRFLYFFGTAGLIVALSLLADEMLNTNFWYILGINKLTGGSAYENFYEVSNRIAELWGSTIETGNEMLTYASTVLFLLIILGFLAGILNSMKDLLIEYLLIATYPMLLTVAYIFLPFDNTTILVATPFLIITASFGITGAFNFIPKALKEHHTTLNNRVDIEVYLDESYYLPGRWGPIVPLEKNVKDSSEQGVIEDVVELEPETGEEVEVKLLVEEPESEEQEPNRSEQEVTFDILDFSVNNQVDTNHPKESELEKVYDMFGIKDNENKKDDQEDFDNISFSATDIYSKKDEGPSDKKKFRLKGKVYDNKLNETQSIKKDINTMVDLLFENKNDKKQKK